jgi:NAD(P)-dependent dehydrogenase (short-subunit alcohol dehydrogenase family)
MNVFLTGATGFIGQSLVRKMRQRGWRVHALVRDTASPPARWLAEQGCELVPGDVTRADGLVQAMTGMDVVIHNAGVYEFGANAAVQARMQQVNVGWSHPDARAMWDRIIDRERQLMGQLSGFLNRLRHQAVVNDQAEARGQHPAGPERLKAAPSQGR